jgi:hypothetical protein
MADFTARKEARLDITRSQSLRRRAEAGTFATDLAFEPFAHKRNPQFEANASLSGSRFGAKPPPELNAARGFMTRGATTQNQEGRYDNIIADFSKWNAAIQSVLEDESAVTNVRQRRSWYKSLWNVMEKGKQIIKELGDYDSTLEKKLRSSSQFTGIQSTLKRLPHFNPFDTTDVGFTAELGPSKNGRKLQLRIFYDHSRDSEHYRYGG